jgi:RNA polymerase II subunit A small phosphatase-like protein
MDDKPIRKLLIFDLDETLLFATEERLELPEAFIVGQYYVYLRPHLGAFLAACSACFDIAVWTASSEDYAAAVVAKLFAGGPAPKFVWASDRCTVRSDPDTREMYRLKDLKKVRAQGYALEHVIVVDDTARKHERNYGNLVTVRPFEGDPADDELVHLERYLLTLADVPNVRAIEKRGWRNRVVPGSG